MGPRTRLLPCRLCLAHSGSRRRSSISDALCIPSRSGALWPPWLRHALICSSSANEKHCGGSSRPGIWPSGHTRNSGAPTSPRRRAFLYVTRSAFRNPTWDRGRIVGMAHPASGVQALDPPLRLAGLEFTTACYLSIVRPAPRGEGVELAPLVKRLRMFPKPHARSAWLRLLVLGPGMEDAGRPEFQPGVGSRADYSAVARRPHSLSAVVPIEDVGGGDPPPVPNGPPSAAGNGSQSDSQTNAPLTDEPLTSAPSE
jgi:hypothetical protein